MLFPVKYTAYRHFTFDIDGHVRIGFKVQLHIVLVIHC